MMTHHTLLNTRCRLISTTGPKGKEIVTAETETGQRFQTTIAQFNKDWKPITHTTSIIPHIEP
jgi:hypothetical protein